MEKDSIKELLNNGNINDAIAHLDSLINTEKRNDELFYLRGNAYRKNGDWQKAIENYLEAISINPESPAKEAYNMVISILEFYNKDMFNQ